MTTTAVPTEEKTTGISRFIPILSWLPRYNRSWLTVDVIAGLTLWGLAVPEAMAYAGIAGLPPQAGLYTLLAALLVYAVFGTSRHLVVQATSATAALLASAVAAALVATAAANRFRPGNAIRLYASAFVLVTGLVFLAAGAGAVGLHHAVPLQAGDGRLRDRPGDLRRRGPAQQALRGAQTRGQHGGEAAGDHQGAAAG